jgi:hypothetical protein
MPHRGTFLLSSFGENMNTEFDSVWNLSPTADDRPRLFESVFSEPPPFTKAVTQTEDGSRPFKPTSSDVVDFLKDHSLFGPLDSTKLDAISTKAREDGNVRKQLFSEYLDAHINDVSSLSNDGVSVITRGDMRLYEKFLRNNELSPDPSNPNPEDWEKLHYEYEINNSALPLLGMKVGLAGGFYGAEKLMTHPTYLDELGKLKTRNPRAALFMFAGTKVAAMLGAALVGLKIGEKVNVVANSDGIKRHFVDEAAPAMKRLLQE